MISNEEIMELKFVGKKYNNNKEKLKIIEDLDEFERRKILWLNELYVKSKLTMESYWRVYKAHIYEYEILKRQDLMNFTIEDIKGIIFTNINIQSSTQRALKTMISGYLNWCISKGWININVASKINVFKESVTNKKVLSQFTVSIKDIENLLNIINTEDTKLLSLERTILLLLSRYGINISWLSNLKFSDIDKENKLINIVDNDNIIVKLPIDNVFIYWINKLKEEYPDREYILMYEDKKGNLKRPNKNWISRSLCIINDAIIENKEINDFNLKLSNSDLLKARILDFLIRIRMERYLRVKDIANICNIFDINKNLTQVSSKTSIIKKIYEELTDNEDFIVSKGNKVRTPKHFNTKCLDKLVNEYNVDIDYIKENVPLITDENLHLYLPE